MKYIEYFEKEIRTDVVDLYTIYLYHEGDWWRAYEWSAYLCEFYPNDVKEKLKPNKKVLKEHEEGLISVGLKLKSFDKYLPNVIKEEVDNIIKLNVKDIFPDDFTLEMYKKLLLDWKNSTPFKSETRQNNEAKNLTVPPFVENINVSQNVFSLTSIMGEILTYKIEEHSMKENTDFISYLKDKLIRLIY